MVKFTSEQVATWLGGAWCGAPPATFTGVSTDTRTLEAGCLYIPIEGERFDGHTFLQQALSEGAGGALAMEGKASGCLGAILTVPDTRKALSQLASGYRATLPFEKVVGITGSVGKTTVKEMTAAVLACKGTTTKTKGNWNNDLGVPLSILAAPSDTAYGVFELGMNHPGELAPLCALLKPEWGITTTVGMAHSGFFDSEKDIALEKAALFASLPSDGLAFVSRNNPWFEILAEASAAPVVTASLEGEGDYVATRVEPASGTFRVEEKASGEGGDMVLPQPGAFMVENALLAIALGRKVGLGWEVLQGAMNRYALPPMRWEEELVSGVTFINDAYNANPLSMRAALDTFAGLPGPGRKWLVLGGMYELGGEEEVEHRGLGAYIAGGPWAGLVTFGRLGQWIAEGAGKADSTLEVIHCDNHPDAARTLHDTLQPDDVVLLKASRADGLEQVIEQWKKENP